MLNALFVVVVLASILVAAWSGRMEELTGAIVGEAKNAVVLALGLVGLMAFFLGLMQVVERAGLLRGLCRLLAPVMRRLFPSVPPDHPAMSAMLLNIGSNMMGLANAATPFGIKAMEELDRLNGRKGTATNAMVLFLAINTAGLAILPSGVISLRAALGSTDPAGILLSTWFASATATLVGVTAALLLSRLPRYRASEPPPADPTPLDPLRTEVDPAAGAAPLEAPGAAPGWRIAVAAGFGLLLVALLARWSRGAPEAESAGGLVRHVFSFWFLPVLVGVLVLLGWVRGVRVYDAVVEGAKDGFQVALRIIPFLVAILVAVGMLRASGGLDLIVGPLGVFTERIGLPAEALPMALLRPLTGSGAYGVMAEVMKVHGPDSFLGYLVSTLQGSTETTFYVLAVYFGAVGVTRTRHTVPACLLADAAALLAAVLIVNLLWG